MSFHNTPSGAFTFRRARYRGAFIRNEFTAEYRVSTPVSIGGMSVFRLSGASGADRRRRNLASHLFSECSRTGDGGSLRPLESVSRRPRRPPQRTAPCRTQLRQAAACPAIHGKDL